MDRSDPAQLRAGSFLLPEVRTKRLIVKADDDSRTVTAVFATLGVKDLDGDVVNPGAVGEQDVFMGAYNHDFSGLPPGMGATFETKTEARFRGQFFSTWAGDQHYQTIKEAGGQMEWSWRFYVDEGGWETRDGDDVFVIRKARITHVAPVEAGAGIHTRTLEVKSCGPGCEAAKSARSKGEVGGPQPPVIDLGKLAEAVAHAMKTTVHDAVARALAAKSGDCGCGGSTDDCACGDKSTQGADTGASSSPAQSSTSTTNAGQTPPQKQSSTPELKGEGLGDLIRRLRDEKELTNDDLAEAAGLAVSSIGGILAGTTSCPKIGQLQGLARRLGVSLSSLVSAAESDGCEVYGGTDASADNQGGDKAEESAEEKAGSDRQAGDAGEGSGEDDDPDAPISDEVLVRQIEDLLSGFDGEDDGIDPGLKAWQRYQDLISCSEV